jgi:hypothetical protein
MPTTPRVKLPYPDQNTDPWYDQFVSLVNTIDTTLYAAREDRNVVLMGGGTIVWTASTNTLSWSAPLELTSAPTGFLWTVAAGSQVILDGQFVYFQAVRSPSSNAEVATYASGQVPYSAAQDANNSIVLAVRRGSVAYFRNGAVIQLVDGLPQSLSPSGLTGSGSSGTLTKWNGSSSLTNSIITDNGSLVTISGALDVAGNVKVKNGGAGSIALSAPAGTYALTYALPASYGSNGQVLTTNGSGTLSWTSVSGGGISGSGTSGTVPKWNGTSSLTNSSITDTGSLVTVGVSLDVVGVLKIKNAGAGFVSFTAPVGTYSLAYTLPSADGTNGQVLTTNGSGTLSWTTAGGGGGGGVSGSGTMGTIPKWSTSTALTDSAITEDSIYVRSAKNMYVNTLSLGCGTANNTSNTIFGKSAYSGAYGTVNTVVGYYAFNSGEGPSFMDGITVIGANAMGNIYTAFESVAVGLSALAGKYFDPPSSSSNRNVAIGAYSMYYCESASNNVGVGSFTLQNIKNTAGNTAIGHSAMAEGTAIARNVAVGQSALNDGTIARNASITDNIAVGFQAAISLQGAASYNIAIGHNALSNATGCHYNVIVGNSSGTLMNGSYYNVLVGASAGVISGSPLTGSNVIAIGYSSQPSSASVSDEITLGNSFHTVLRCNVTSITSLSDARDKKEVEDLPLGLDFVQKLRPVKFVWDTRDGSKKDVVDAGFIAQELDQAQQDANADWMQLVYSENPERLEATPGRLIPVLVKAVQELAAEVAQLRALVKGQ